MSRIIIVFMLSAVISCAVCTILPNAPFDLSVRKAPRLNIPLLNIGVKCNGCPGTCEDDPAIIYGYCCGCARLLDKLPVLCPKKLDCPLNGAGLCHDYEYMMVCCC